jgi:hypothetical protein
VTVVAGTFQYFYSTRELSKLPYPEVPTRDVTNSNKAGYKTEPFLEQRLENWCKCRAIFVTAAAKRSLRMSTNGGQHYLLLTTRHPVSRKPFVVGLMPFVSNRFYRMLRRHPGRWSREDYLPYVSDRRMKLVAFEDAFPLQNWMSQEGNSTIPGGQGGPGRVPNDLLRRVLRHFSVKPDRTNAFLANVRRLKILLRTTDREKWKEYQDRLPTGGGDCQRC